MNLLAIYVEHYLSLVVISVCETSTTKSGRPYQCPKDLLAIYVGQDSISGPPLFVVETLQINTSTPTTAHPSPHPPSQPPPTIQKTQEVEKSQKGGPRSGGPQKALHPTPQSARKMSQQTSSPCLRQTILCKRITESQATTTHAHRATLCTRDSRDEHA
jgi:hypothetical protein